MKHIFSITSTFTLVFFTNFLFAQKGTLNINVYDDFSKSPLQAEILAEGINRKFLGEGNVVLDSLQAGEYSLRIMVEGYEDGFLNDINVLPNQNLTFSIGLNKSNSIDEVVIRKKLYKSSVESPVSLRNITSEEVQKNAGSNRDVSKAILSFPGVGSTATFRNDLFIRGGSSSENKFYIDGIEVPIINHFQTQGASGGPRGIITVDFIKDVDFYSGAFPAKRNDVLSSLFEFSLKPARKDKIGYKAVLGLDDMQLMADGPLSKDQSWTGLFSVRKSNLQLLFNAIGLPFLPSYYDTTFKVSKTFKNGDELYFIGLGAKDEFKFNDKAKKTLSNLTLIDRLPVSPQWNYTFGAGYRHIANNGNWLFTLSRNMLDNQSLKYYKNIESPTNLLFDYHSQESENKIRIDRNFNIEDYKVSSGINVNYAKYYNKTISRNVSQNAINFDQIFSNLNLLQYGVYTQASKSFFSNRLQISTGIRFDASNYSDKMSNPFQQFSPRLSAKYNLNSEFALSMNTGIYYQLPAYTALGFTSATGEYVNQSTLKYIRSEQFVTGIEYNGQNNLRLTLEGYYKKYKNYPFSLRNQVSLANLGADFGAIGNEPLDARGKGETYGIEFLAQKRTISNYYGILSYTFGHSKFSNAKGKLMPSAWDSRHILTFTGGKYFKRNWNIGARFRMQSGLPETPYDLQRSALVNVWNVSNSPVLNYSLLNSNRGNLVHQLDIRAEKKWIFTKWQLTFYVDVVNAYGSKSPSNLPVVALERNLSGDGIISNPLAPQDQQMYELNFGTQDKTTTLPYFGIIIEF